MFRIIPIYKLLMILSHIAEHIVSQALVIKIFYVRNNCIKKSSKVQFMFPSKLLKHCAFKKSKKL